MSECAKLQKGDYVTNSIGRSVSIVFPIIPGVSSLLG